MDLRLTSPFEELRHYVDSIVWEELDPTERVHIPYVVILIQCLDNWRTNHHQGKIPGTRDEQEEFKRSLLKLRGCHENVEEAIANAHRIWSTIEIPDRVKWCLEKARSMPLTKSLGNFWILMKALVEFVDTQGMERRLPLNSHIPDMMASTSRYTELQTLYQLGARRDLQWMRDKTDELLSSIGRSSGSIDPSLLKRFCENARWLDVIHYVSYYEDDPKQLRVLGRFE
jgi:NEDD8-activating enzyme E1 regulatory subunit